MRAGPNRSGAESMRETAAPAALALCPARRRTLRRVQRQALAHRDPAAHPRDDSHHPIHEAHGAARGRRLTWRLAAHGHQGADIGAVGLEHDEVAALRTDGVAAIAIRLDRTAERRALRIATAEPGVVGAVAVLPWPP